MKKLDRSVKVKTGNFEEIMVDENDAQITCLENVKINSLGNIGNSELNDHGY